MRKEYDIEKLKVKRRGILPALQAGETTGNKVRITIALDKEIIDYFKSEANHPDAFPYQTQINQALRKLINKWHGVGHEDIEALKKELLSDVNFIRKLAKKVDQSHAGK